MNAPGDRLSRMLGYMFLVQGAVSLLLALFAIGFVFFGPGEHRPMAIALFIIGIGTAGSMLLVGRGILGLRRGA